MTEEGRWYEEQVRVQDRVFLTSTAAGPITIGDNAWLGGGAIVLAGVSVGENSVVGAGAVVTKDVSPNTVAVGNPARVVRTL